MDSLSPDRIREIRDLYAEFGRRVQHGRVGEIEEIAVMATALAILVPDLLDALEQLQAERTEGGRPRIRDFVKFDGRGGTA